MPDLISIKEQYISPIVLPNEQSSCWIKWSKGTQFDKIILRHEADVDIHRILNVDEKIFDSKDHENSRIEIPKNMMQVDGFFGFTSFYTTILADERKISYSIDFVCKNMVQTVSLSNIITRPKIEVVRSSPHEIIISDQSPPLDSLSLELKSIGSATIRNLSYFIEFVTDDKLQVKLVSKPNNTNKLSLNNERTYSQELRIQGKGNGIMKIGVEYFDARDTKYENVVKEIPTIVKQRQNTTIPFSEQIVKPENELLTVPAQ